jgi:hypothetical protein
MKINSSHTEKSWDYDKSERCFLEIVIMIRTTSNVKRVEGKVLLVLKNDLISETSP